MVVVKVYMWPRGDHEREELLGVGTLALEQVTATGRSYRVTILKLASFIEGGAERLADPRTIHRPRSKDVWKRGHVRGHNPSYRGPWDLLGGALRELLGGRLRSYRVDR